MTWRICAKRDSRWNNSHSWQTVDWTGSQIKNDDSAEDMKNIDLTCVHHLSGPIAVKDKEGNLAQPGDLLVVEILDLGALPGDEWGKFSFWFPLYLVWPIQEPEVMPHALVYIYKAHECPVIPIIQRLISQYKAYSPNLRSSQVFFHEAWNKNSELLQQNLYKTFFQFFFLSICTNLQVSQEYLMWVLTFPPLLFPSPFYTDICRLMGQALRY